MKFKGDSLCHTKGHRSVVGDRVDCEPINQWKIAKNSNFKNMASNGENLGDLPLDIAYIAGPVLTI